MNYMTELPTRPPRDALPFVEAQNRLVDRDTYRHLCRALHGALTAPTEALRRECVQRAAVIAEGFMPVPG